MGNGNSTSSKSKVNGHHAPRQGKPSTKDQVLGFPYGTKGASFRGEYVDKPKVEATRPFREHHGLGAYSEQHGQKSLDNDDSFTEYIQRAKQKIRTVSKISREHSNPAPATAPDGANSTNEKENQNNEFSEFIQLAKKKLKTTSRVGKNNGSFKRG